MKQKFYLLFNFIFFMVFYAVSQQQTGTHVKPYYGNAGIKKSLEALKATAGAQSAIGKKLDSTAIKPIRSYYKRFKKFSNPNPVEHDIIDIFNWKENGQQSAKKLSEKTTGSFQNAESTQKIWSNFLAIDFNENPIGWPPDPSGAVGDKQVIVSTNNGLKIFNKTSVTDDPLVTPASYSAQRADGFFISLESFFSPVLPKKSGISDPHIRYDRLTKRWYVVAIEVNPSQSENLILLAVSDGDNVLDGSSFTFYAFNSSLFPFNKKAPYAPFLDYPTLGIDRNAVVIGGNQFGYDSLTNVGYIIDKRALVHGKLIVYPFELGVANFIDTTVKGIVTPQAVHNDDPATRKSLFAGITYNQDGIGLACIHYDKNNVPSLMAQKIVAVSPFSFPRDITSPGGLSAIDGLDTRLFAAEIHKNKITGQSSLWTAHAIGINKSGELITGSDSDFVRQARTASRWYQISDVFSKPSISQTGTLYDKNQASGRRAVQYFNPSIATSGQGHTILSGTTDAYNQYLNVFVAGRYNGDEAGTLKPVVKATDTYAIYAPYINYGGSNFYVNRWGDYSQTVVDPMDDQSIWTFQEYANVDDSYGVRAVQLKAPPPATPMAFKAISNSNNATITLMGTCTENSGFFDPGEDKWGPGYNRLTVKSTGGIIVSDVKFDNPLQITFQLKVKGIPAGKYDLVITNPDGQFVLLNYEVTGSSTDKIITATSPTINNAALNFITATSVYPNPAKDNTAILIMAAKNHQANIVVVDLNGKQVFEQKISLSNGSNKAIIPLAGLSSGTYLASIYNEDKILLATQKIVKQ